MKSIQFNNEVFFPSKVICIGKNYAAHIEEMQSEVPEQPVIFIKPNSAISDDVLFNEQDRIDYEAEISFLVSDGKYVAVAFGLDLTKRLVQKKLKTSGLPWERAKAFDNSAVFSKFVALDCSLSALRLELWINETLTQSANYELMLTKPSAIKDEIESFLTLEDNDVVMTGTPKGVGPIQLGDVFVGRILANEHLLVEQSWEVK